MLDQFSRSRILLGTEAMDKLAASRVIIFGVGGVGSYVAEGLVRCGVGHFILVDNDDVSLTNINIVDAIDTVKSKIDLAVEAQKRQIPIISSMGAANKLNPAMLQVSDIYKTSVCPLARALRQKLKKLGVKKLKVVYSQEEPLKLLEIEGQMEKPAGAKYTTPGSVSFVPSVAGMIVASEVVKDLCGIIKNR